jgi:hypothetical protein
MDLPNSSKITNTAILLGADKWLLSSKDLII